LNKVVSNKVVSNKVVSNKVVSNKVVSNKVVSNKVVSNKVVLNKVVSNKILSSVTFKSDHQFFQLQLLLAIWLIDFLKGHNKKCVLISHSFEEVDVITVSEILGPIRSRLQRRMEARAARFF
jgi:hypothetical protein